MRLCQVIGNVAASVKHPAFHGRTLLVVQPVSPAGEELGSSFLAVDTVQAGPGDRVLVMSEGNGVRQILNKPAEGLPIRSLVVGIVDAVSVDDDTLPATSTAKKRGSGKAKKQVRR